MCGVYFVDVEIWNVWGCCGVYDCYVGGFEYGFVIFDDLFGYFVFVVIDCVFDVDDGDVLLVFVCGV